ncbi:cycloeucalenol cycloisomerase [Tanacetum coccineum]
MLVIKRFSERKKVFRERKIAEKFVQRVLFQAIGDELDGFCLVNTRNSSESNSGFNSEIDEHLSSKARLKPRSPPQFAYEEDLGQRLQATLLAAEQKKAFFPICASEHFYVVVFHLKNPSALIILDNSDCGDQNTKQFVNLIDVNMADLWDLPRVAVDALGAAMLVTIILDLWRLFLVPIVPISDNQQCAQPGLPWFPQHTEL